MTATTTKRKVTAASQEAQVVRCAIYARQSVDRSTGQDLGSIEAQAEVCASYIASQKHSGWMALPNVYSDAGFSGATVDRPAFARLMEDVKAGKIDAVVCYKLDRISRSLLDFAGIMRTLEEHNVALVSVTQSFSTSTPMGRLTLNILMSFAAFERELISERTRDKLRQTRLRGLWTGGRCVLGYDIVKGRLVVNQDEALRVRQIFELYAKLGSLLSVAEELRHRGWRGKDQKAHDVIVPGKAFDKGSVRRVLGNATYVGKLLVDGDQACDGVHEPIVDRALFDLVQDQLRHHAREPGPARRQRSGHLLLGIARCKCGSALTHHYTARPGGKRYSFYLCAKMQKQGAASCPGSRISTRQLDQFVVEKLTAIGRHPDVIAETIAAAKRTIDAEKPAIEAEIRRPDGERKRLTAERANLVAAVAQGGAAPGALTTQVNETEQALQETSRRADEQRGRLAALEAGTIDEADLRRALESFDELWAEMTTIERARVIGLLIEVIVFDGKSGDLSITFRPSGVRLLASEIEQRKEA